MHPMAFVIACYSDPGLHVCRGRQFAPGIRHLRNAACSRHSPRGRPLRCHCHRPALDPAAHALTCAQMAAH